MADWWAGYLWGVATWPLVGVALWVGFWALILIGTLRWPR